MSFISVAFVFLLAAVLLARVAVGRDQRATPFLLILLGASLLFYSWHVPYYLLLILTSAAVDWWAARRIATEPRGTRRRLVLVLSLVANLGMLGFFKYADFATRALADAVTWLGGDWHPMPLGLALPIGISFYTFQSMSYTIDVYRGHLRPERSPWKFLLFVSFFPQLVAGPIVRAREFLPQLEHRRGLRAPFLLEGSYLVIQGLFLKRVVADNLAPVVDHHWEIAAGPEGSALLSLGVALLFSCQIFGDFCGYSRIARGCALLLGFRLPQNFDAPYLARSFREFWTRWHITLSQWLRDYLYVSLGGNRGSRWATTRNLLLVMLLGGLWHGAAWNFVIWGAIHGAALALERGLGLQRERDRSIAARLLWFAVVQTTVLAAWVFFRSATSGEALAILSSVFSGPWLGETSITPLVPALLFTLPVWWLHGYRALEETGRVGPPSGPAKAVAAGLMTYLILTCYGRSHAFIYFQF